MNSKLHIHPALLPLASFILGIAAAGSYGLTVPEAGFNPALLLFLPLLFLKSPAIFRLASITILFIIGNLMIQPGLKTDLKLKSLIDSEKDQQFVISGVITDRPVKDDNGLRLVVKVNSLQKQEETPIPFRGMLAVRVSDPASGTVYSGDTVSFTSKLKTPRNYGTPGEFDAENYYKLKKIAATGFVNSNQTFIVTGFDSNYRLANYFDKTAERIANFIKLHIHGVNGAVLSALLVGDASGIPTTLKDAYSRTGVNHILSISGFHIGIIALALYQFWSTLLRLFPATLLYINLKKTASLASIPAIAYYMFLSGAAPATARSVIMIFFIISALLIERETDHTGSIAIAAALLLAINPANLYDISFQLSFLAIWGLTVITPLLSDYEPLKKWKAMESVSLFAAASTAAVLVTLIPVALYFQQISVTGIISNFLIVPLLGYGAVITGGIAVILIPVYEPLAVFALAIAASLTDWSNRLIELLDKIPLLPAFIPGKTDILILLLTLLAITVMRKRTYQLCALLVAPSLIAALHIIPPDTAYEGLRVDFISVGQGEATLLRLPDRKSILIDGGGSLFDNSRDVGRQLLLPALRHAGVRKIDIMILTHSHPDHIKGLLTVAAALPVGEFWETGRNSGSDYSRLVDQLKNKSTSCRILNSDSPQLEISGLKINCLAPFTGNDGKDWLGDQNELSMVLKLTYEGRRLLFTGDIGIPTELALIRRKADLKTDILKVPHHGSGYSSTPEFINAAKPEYAVISAGFGNSFGLPADETVARIRNCGATIYRTDLDGTVSFFIPARSGKPSVKTAIRQIN